MVTPPAPNPAPPTCAEGAGSESRMRRLTQTQYRNSLRELFAWALGDRKQADGIMAEIAQPLGRWPKDRHLRIPEDRHGAYRRMDQDVTQAHMEAAITVGQAAGTALTQAGRLGRVVGSCAVDADAANDAECISSFISRLAERALRRPPTSDETAFLHRVYGAGGKVEPGALADVIATSLNLPPFLYLVEHGAADAPGKNGAVRLSTFELAARLSYHFWQMPPDDQLYAAAKSGALSTPDVYAAEVDRLVRDSRAEAAADELYADWLKLDDVEGYEGKLTDPLFVAFAGADLPAASIRQAMIDDVAGLMRHFTWTRQGGLADILSTELSFARDPGLAKIYGVPPWDGKSEPPALQPAGSRPGLLTRAALLAAAGANTRPIAKGVFVRERVLCDAIPPPPEDVPADANVNLSPQLSTRQVVEKITGSGGCAACHTTFINPLGYATENFDALGRRRTEQRLFDEQGRETGRVPIDTRAEPQVVAGDRRSAAGAKDLVSQILESGKASDCLARQYFRFTFGRWEDTVKDGCTLERLRSALDGQPVTNAGQPGAAGGGGKGTLAAMLRAVALAPDFQYRVFP